MTKIFSAVLLFFISISTMAMQKDKDNLRENNPLFQTGGNQKNTTDDLPKKTRTEGSYFSKALIPKNDVDETLPLKSWSDDQLPSKKKPTENKKFLSNEKKPPAVFLNQHVTKERRKKNVLDKRTKQAEQANFFPDQILAATVQSTPNMLKTSSFFQSKETIFIPLLSNAEILRHILTNNVSVLQKQNLPAEIEKKSLSEWAYRGGSYYLAKALDPKSVGHAFSWSSAKLAAPRLQEAKENMFFGATYGDLSLIQQANLVFIKQAEKTGAIFYSNIINERLETSSDVARRHGYNLLATYLETNAKLTPTMRKEIQNECLKQNKYLLINARDDEQYNWFSFHVAKNADELIASEFSETFLGWLSGEEFKSSITRLDKKNRREYVHQLGFAAYQWNMLDRKKLLLSKSIFENDVKIALENLTSFKKKEFTDHLFSNLNCYKHGFLSITDLISRIDKLIEAGADLEAKYKHKKKRSRTAAEFIDELGLDVLALALSNKYIWFLFDKEKLTKFLEGQIFINNYSQAGFY